MECACLRCSAALAHRKVASNVTSGNRFGRRPSARFGLSCCRLARHAEARPTRAARPGRNPPGHARHNRKRLAGTVTMAMGLKAHIELWPWPFGEIDGPFNWNKTHPNQWNPSIFNQTNLKRTPMVMAPANPLSGLTNNRPSQARIVP